MSGTDVTCDTGLFYDFIYWKSDARYLCPVFAALIDNRGPHKMVPRHGESVMALKCVLNYLKLGSAYLRSGQTTSINRDANAFYGLSQADCSSCLAAVRLSFNGLLSVCHWDAGVEQILSSATELHPIRTGSSLCLLSKIKPCRECPTILPLSLSPTLSCSLCHHLFVQSFAGIFGDL